ncbi:Trypanosomal VSG domain containing protein [Trypanosoma brucei equiperdum]|uniref:Trypanosomal VSG domain containing protein n=1 Tax=Trypanosoma brucei equiperdum TaxID=630700 RepID=A0A3L6LGV0_9TRYP|nr:Trypanosomal VSG domain containing protein [Trypanosoma brucei equiperdum]
MFKLLYLLLALTMCCTTKLGQSAGEALNGPEFNLFCHMDVMLKKEEIKDDDEPDLTEAAKAAETTIDTIFTLTANDTYYDNGPEPNAGTGGEDASQKQNRINQCLQTRSKFDNVAIADTGAKQKYRRVKHKDIPVATLKLLDVTHNRAGQIRDAIRKPQKTSPPTRITSEQQLAAPCSAAIEAAKALSRKYQQTPLRRHTQQRV